MADGTVRIEPTAPHAGTIILIHGLGDSALGWKGEARQWSRRRPDLRFILPTAYAFFFFFLQQPLPFLTPAPVCRVSADWGKKRSKRRITINNGMIMTGWYDITTLDADAAHERVHDDAGIEESRDRIMALVREEMAAGVPSERILLAGFSQGAAMSLYTTYLSSEKLAGCVCMSGYLLRPDHWAENLHEANKGTPLLMCHGTSDPVVQYAWAEFAAERARKAGLDVRFESYERMGHATCASEMSVIRTFVNQLLPSSLC
eukprot:TRINITY_DN3181_c0_g1_i2.p1 TRINITY_DN3181_c0_g1~~TRINITY_DN3181_c0_g1_i2.p1  ORF type:complete len:280 (+),score=55.79 TRINITY_DN3181_c0_g1_i2:61-840(+)